MRIGIFADIHGNIYAFERIMAAFKRELCDAYCFAGDICGYYYHQNEIVGHLRGMKDLFSVAGNHDAAFLDLVEGSFNGAGYRKRYGKSLDILKRSVEKNTLDFLSLLPPTQVIAKERVLMCHGSPWDNLNEYIYPTDPLDRFRGLGYKFVILGHTHYPMVKKIGDVCVINPGSCGQPRDTNSASYAVLDTGTGECRIKRVAYDVEAMVREVLGAREENSYLSEVLKRKASDGR